MNKVMMHPISFSVEIRTFPKPGSIQHWTLKTTQELHGFSSSACPFTIRADGKTAPKKTEILYERN
jgi:hypothetical protein